MLTSIRPRYNFQHEQPHQVSRAKAHDKTRHRTSNAHGNPFSNGRHTSSSSAVSYVMTTASQQFSSDFYLRESEEMLAYGYFNSYNQIHTYHLYRSRDNIEILTANSDG
eukprot:scaffold293835_cov37-Prasinocladus_malaysianus.AAC.2